MLQKSDLLSNNRKLLSEGTIRWMSARGKAFGKFPPRPSDQHVFRASVRVYFKGIFNKIPIGFSSILQYTGTVNKNSLP